MEQNRIESVDSPVSHIARQLDDPTTAENIAWQNLTITEKRVLIRAASCPSTVENFSWFRMKATHRMAIRSAIEKITRITSAFGGYSHVA